MPAPLPLHKRAELKARGELGEGVRQTARETGLSIPTVIKYFKDGSRDGEEGFRALVDHAKQSRVQEWIAIAALARRKVLQALPSIEIKNTMDLKNVVIVAAIATDKALLLEGKMPPQVPPALALYVNQLNVNSPRQININDGETRNLLPGRERQERLEAERQRAEKQQENLPGEGGGSQEPH
jgi:hypothetical protein